VGADSFNEERVSGSLEKALEIAVVIVSCNPASMPKISANLARSKS
jgi:tRNA/tmRNA/rRNA uracil-C5-methylase (TrmA/RlmC/RlmD family)